MSITVDEEGTIIAGEVKDDTPEEDIVRVEIECDCGTIMKVIGLRDSEHWNPFKDGAKGLTFKCSECPRKYVVKPDGGHKPHKELHKSIGFPW